MERIITKDLGIVIPDWRVNMGVGPGKNHRVSEEVQDQIRRINSISHRSQPAKDVLKRFNSVTFDIFNIPVDQRNNPSGEGWHIAFTGSGSDGIARTIRAIFDPENPTTLVNTDNFSLVAAKDAKAMNRPCKQIDFEFGKGLTVDSPEFEELKQQIEQGVSTIYLTGNATTAGVDQFYAIGELVKYRNECGSNTIIAVDAVSAQIYGRFWNPETMPDVLFWSNQKDTGAEPGTGNMIFNNRVLARARMLREKRVDTGGKLGLEDSFGKPEALLSATGQTPQTPGLGQIYRNAVVTQFALENKTEINKTQLETSKRFWNALKEGGQLHDIGFRSPVADPLLCSVTSLVAFAPEGLSVTKMLAHFESLGIYCAPGYAAAHKDRVIRMGFYSAGESIEEEEVEYEMTEFAKAA